MMPRWLAASVLAVFLALSGYLTGLAQANLSFSKLEVDLWPEYDRPDMLVIEHFTLDPTTTLPANITLRIPAAAGNPYNLAARNTDGNLYNLTYTTAVKGDWNEVTFSAPTAEIQLEYYDAALNKNGKDRTYTYTWPGGFGVKAASIVVQQPSGASNLQSTPAAGSPVTGENGLSYYTLNMGEVKSPNTLTYSLTYQKPDDSLSVQTGQVQPSGPINSSTTGLGGLTTTQWVILLAVLAVVLIGVGGFMYWRTTRQAVPASQHRRHLKPAVRADAVSPAGDAIYCHKCGKRAGPGDVFCRSCGTRLRKEEP